MTLTVPPELLARYDQPGPRYTSYPTAPAWSSGFGGEQHRAGLARAGEAAGAPLAMYVHVPFCASMCFYCGCSVVISKDAGKGVRYVGEVLQEAALARAALGGQRPVVQHHWGGGTPTFLPPDQLERLFRGLTALFPLAEDAEVSIEVDPRVTTAAQLAVLAACGFNRISMGVQDFDPQVQRAIHREQSLQQTRDVVEAARGFGFRSVNIDVVYGLPHQDEHTWRRTLQDVVELRADRIACYGYAHVPWLKKHQRVIPEAALPRGAAKLALYLAALEVLQAAGYAPIGMDHFALPGDTLLVASRAGRLHRNFMGYTTAAAEDMLSFGVSAISEVSRGFAQNVKALHEYRACLQAGRLPVERGLLRSADDERRRRIILDLMCRFGLRYTDHGGAPDFQARYAAALDRLRPQVADGLVVLDGAGIHVTELGRLFVRNVAMPFDAYLERQMAGTQPVFSRTV